MNRYVRIIKLDLKEILSKFCDTYFCNQCSEIYRNLKEVQESDEGIVYH